MMKKTTKHLFCLGIIILFSHSCSNTFEKNVEISVREQLNSFPESRLQDIYKNFFQDRYGFEYVTSDTSISGYNLRKECDSCNHAYMKMVEEIGWEKNYCRVSTHILKLGYVPYDTYFNAFIESADSLSNISLNKWKVEWNSILSVIEKMNLNIPNYESDKIKIERLLNSREYILGHSDQFNHAYHPHYRVIKKDVFLKKIKPYLTD